MRRLRGVATLALVGVGWQCALMAEAPLALAVQRGPGSARAAPGMRTSHPPRQKHRRHGPFAVGLRILRLVDRSRTIAVAGGRREPRTLVTYVRYPAPGRRGAQDLRGAPPERAGGPYPLVVFAHGYAITPGAYTRMLRAWASAGYIVAAPTFPLTNARARGGPRRGDIYNEPRDMSFVITQLLAKGALHHGTLSAMIARGRVAVAGHSDGGAVALATAYARRSRDRRVGAAVVLSGAAFGPFDGFARPARRLLPLLAVQGTRDTVNGPGNTYAYYAQAPRPKYLLRLLGAQHLPPYTYEQPQLRTVERVTIAFLDRYLKRGTGAARRLAALAHVRGVSALTSQP